MMFAIFNGNPCITTLSCYSPTNASDKTNVTTFYTKLSLLVWYIPIRKVLIVGVDMNSFIGKDGNNKFCLHNSPNKNGEYQADFSLENRLVCLNTKFQKGRVNYGLTQT